MNLARRLVFDTSALIGAVLRPDSVPRQAFMAALTRYELCISSATLGELEAVLQRRKFNAYAAPQQRQAFLTLYRQQSRLWPVDTHSEQVATGACRDSRDDKFLALALSCEAVALVTSDDDLLTLGVWRGVRILTPPAFLEVNRP